MVTVDYDGVSTKLMIILMIVLGIWVIREVAISYGVVTHLEANGYYNL